MSYLKIVSHLNDKHDSCYEHSLIFDIKFYTVSIASSRQSR